MFHYQVYCIVATVLEIGQLEAALNQAKKESAGSGIKVRSMALHRILNGESEAVKTVGILITKTNTYGKSDY